MSQPTGKQSNSKLTKNRKRLAKFRGEEFKTDAILVAELNAKNRALKEEITLLTTGNEATKSKGKIEHLQLTCEEQKNLIKELEFENDELMDENTALLAKDGNVPSKRAKTLSNDDRDLRKENSRLRRERDDLRESAESWEKYYDTAFKESQRLKKDLEVSENKNKSVIGTMNSTQKTREIYEYHYLRMSEHVCRLIDVVDKGRTDLFENTGLKIYAMGDEPIKSLTDDMQQRRMTIVKKHAKMSKKSDADVSSSSSSSK